MIYNIYHKTEFKYQESVSFSHNIARLKPKNTNYQNVLDFTMEISPEVYDSSEFFDMFGNVNTYMLIREPHQVLSIVGKSKIEVFPQLLEENIENIKKNSITYQAAMERLSKFHIDDIDAKLYLFESDLIPNASVKIKDYILESFHKDRDIFVSTQEFMGRIFNDFKFVSGFSDITTPIEKIFEAKQGVCQDFAQFAISALRSIGIPAKYMSGYIETLPAKGQKKLFGADASHAWFSIYIPSAGWVDFDPTNNIIPTDQHILLGSGKDYNDISPLKGVVYSSGNSNLSVMVDVRRDEQSVNLIQSMQQTQQ